MTDSERDLPQRGSFEQGVGIRYDKLKAGEGWPEGANLLFVPLYWYGRFHAGPDSTSPYAITRLGIGPAMSNGEYQTIFGTTTGPGLIYGLGLGVPFNERATMEMSLEYNETETESALGKMERVRYGRVKIGILFAF